MIRENSSPSPYSKTEGHKAAPALPFVIDIPYINALTPGSFYSTTKHMKKVLIVGATGQLGTAIFQQLAEQGRYHIRIMVREDSAYEHLRYAQPAIVQGDLKDPASVNRAVEGCDFVIATANSAAPRKKEDSFRKVDIEGYQHLIDVARTVGVEQFIYISASPVPEKWARWIPIVQAKAATEAYLKDSGLAYTIFQPDTFMDIYFAFMGTTIPLQNEPAALINRPFPFMQKFFNGIKDDVALGKIGIIGKGNVPHSYIAIDDVASFVVQSLGNSDLYYQTYPLGGPEALTPLQVKAVFEEVLQRPLRVKKTPRFMMWVLGNLFSLFNEGASNILKLNYMAATVPVHNDCQELARELAIHLTSAETYLRLKQEAFVAIS